MRQLNRRGPSLVSTYDNRLSIATDGVAYCTGSFGLVFTEAATFRRSSVSRRSPATTTASAAADASATRGCEVKLPTQQPRATNLGGRLAAATAAAAAAAAAAAPDAATSSSNPGAASSAVALAAAALPPPAAPSTSARPPADWLWMKTRCGKPSISGWAAGGGAGAADAAA